MSCHVIVSGRTVCVCVKGCARGAEQKNRKRPPSVALVCEGMNPAQEHHRQVKSRSLSTPFLQRRRLRSASQFPVNSECELTSHNNFVPEFPLMHLIVHLIMHPIRTPL